MTTLSICIPTYNRCEYLKKSIESIIHQQEFLDEKVEIVISDNVSTDDTKEICEYYVSKYSNFIYHRNEVNINNDNFPLVLSLGNGLYRRLCNDTLCFNDGALKYICDIIEKYKDSRPQICWLGLQGDEIKSYSFLDGLKKISFWMTSIACFGVWDDECTNIKDDTAGAELLLWQVRKTLELASEKDNVLVVNKILTSTQGVKGKNISYGLFHVFYENYFKLIDPYVENGIITIGEKEYLEKDLLLNFFPGWCAMWRVQNSSLNYSKTEDLYQSIYNQYHNKSYWYKFVLKYRIMVCKQKIKKILKRGY